MPSFEIVLPNKKPIDLTKKVIEAKSKNDIKKVLLEALKSENKKVPKQV
tara:strand:- start:100 stop:246 length:147 start_codon:yes stop_codon:yes gene_type:complete